MFRFSIGFITSAAALSMVAVSLGDAAAQAPGKKAGPPAAPAGPTGTDGPRRRLLWRVPHRPWPVPRRGPPCSIHRPAGRRPAMAPRIAAPSRPSPRIRGSRTARRLRSSAPPLRRAPQAASSGGSRPSSSASKTCERGRRLPRAQATRFRRVSRPCRVPRLQQLQSKSRLSRADRRELRALQRSERQNAQRNNLQPQTAQTAQQDRLQQLQSKGRLSRAERRELRTLQRNERQNAQQQQQQNQPAAAAAIQNQQPRALRTQAVTAQQAMHGRFASGLRTNAIGPGSRFAGRRAARLAARTAWQLGLLAPYVPWRGPVYYPYAYNDIFYYTFWPEAYDPGYWAYAYDDMFDGVFSPTARPMPNMPRKAPMPGRTAASPPARRQAGPPLPDAITQATRDFCAEQAKGVTAWPLEQIAAAVQPTEDQKALLADLQKAAEDAAARFRDACPDAVPMTPPGRLQVMLLRLQAIDEAIQTVKPALQAFYSSLNDEQKARFNEIGQQLGQPRQQRTASGNAQAAAANCSADKAGISDLAINRIEEIVRPTDAQGAALDKLDAAMQKAVETIARSLPEHDSADAGRAARRDAEAGGGDDRRRQHPAPRARGILRLLERRAEGEVQPARPRARAARRLASQRDVSHSCNGGGTAALFAFGGRAMLRFRPIFFLAYRVRVDVARVF